MRPLPFLFSSLLIPSTQSSVLQHPFQGSLPVMPPTSDNNNGGGRGGNNDGDNPSQQPSVPLGDILGTHRSLTTFSSLTRLSSPIETLLADLQTNTTVLAPLNSAIEALPRKPWEDPSEYSEVGENAYEGDDGRERAERNLRRFVEAHLVTTNPWVEGKADGTARTIEGEGKARELWWEMKDGKKVIMPDGVEVDRVASQVANGEVWILKGVLNYL